MAIQITGDVTVGVDRARAFAFLADPHQLSQCIPGCGDLTELAPGRYSAVLTNSMAFITLKFKVNVELLRVDPPNSIEARISGDAVGLSGRVSAVGAFNLSDATDLSTLIRYTAEVMLNGRLGGIGESVFRATSAKLAREFSERLKAGIEASAGRLET